MKKFDTAAIMTRAWEIRREREISMSLALRLAWCEAKGGLKKAYYWHMTEDRRAEVESFVCRLGCEILRARLAGEDVDKHMVSKCNILAQALTLSTKEGMVVVDGKTVGLLKHAVREMRSSWAA